MRIRECCAVAHAKLETVILGQLQFAVDSAIDVFHVVMTHDGGGLYFFSAHDGEDMIRLASAMLERQARRIAWLAVFFFGIVFLVLESRQTRA